MKNVAVIGLGKVGLPLALAITRGHYSVQGVDISSEVVEVLNGGKIPPQIMEPGLENYLHEALLLKKFQATTDAKDALRISDIVVVIVPLKLGQDNKPDFSDLDSVTEEISDSIRPETLVIYETTLPIGTTRKRFATVISNRLGLPLDKVFVAFSPERIFSGAYLQTLAKIPKVVGGINQDSTNQTAEFYRSFISKLPGCTDGNPQIEKVTDSETAEFIKIAETTYRDVNIALANTFAMHSLELGLDFSEIRSACNLNAFSHIHKASVSVGGHCIPVYPRLYLSTDSGAELVSEARKINESMPEFFVREIIKRVGSVDGLLVLVKGITYRGNVKELYMSGAYSLRDILKSLGARVVFEDPLYTVSELNELNFECYNASLDLPDVVIFQSDHAQYKNFDASTFPFVKLFVDGRSFVSSQLFPKDKFFSLGSATDSYTPVI